MPLLTDLRSSGGHFLYDLLDAPGTGFASGAGVTAAGTAASGTAVGYATVTFTEILLVPGSIFYGWDQPWGAWTGSPPQVGDTARYPTTGGFRINSDGTCEADAFGTWTYYYNDGSGEVERTITIDGSAQVYPSGATATSAAPGASIYGGVNIAGDAPDVTATAASGTGSAGNIATGAGATAQAIPAQGSVAGGAAASGAGVTASATAADGSAAIRVDAEGAGATASASAASGAASGDVIAVGAGVAVTATAATVTAHGDLALGAIPYECLFTVLPEDFVRAA